MRVGEVARWLKGSLTRLSAEKKQVVQAEGKGGDWVGKERLARSMLKRHLPKCKDDGGKVRGVRSRTKQTKQTKPIGQVATRVVELRDTPSHVQKRVGLA